MMKKPAEATKAKRWAWNCLSVLIALTSPIWMPFACMIIVLKEIGWPPSFKEFIKGPLWRDK
jgi:hypothetical protein